jgi:hypothetical protein
MINDEIESPAYMLLINVCYEHKNTILLIFFLILKDIKSQMVI